MTTGNTTLDFVVFAVLYVMAFVFVIRYVAGEDE